MGEICHFGAQKQRFPVCYHLLMGKMFYDIEQSCNPSFSIGLVKTESDFIVRSVETGLGR